VTADGNTSATSDAILRRWKRLLTVVGIVSIASWCGALGFIIYMAPTRRAPDLATGHVYGWANHGTYVYLSRCEDLVVKAAMALAVVLFVTGAILEHKIDPWQRCAR
jgi:hypothetical protein